jgi:hypothetical protein
VKDELVRDAYRRFFSVTFDNLEASYEGREFRIGADPAAPDQPLATRTLQLVWELATQWLGEQLDVPLPPARPTPVLDVHGFRHFSGGGHGTAAR